MPRSTINPEQLHEQHQLIDVDDLTVRYGNNVILNAISFCIHRGEFIGLIGPNGAGKTTLVRTMLGLEKPSRGKVEHFEARIGYVPQHGTDRNRQVPLSTLEVVRLGAGGNRQVAKDKLKKVGLSADASTPFHTLSSGQQQRVLIAKALATQPDVLVLDEPTTGIDEQSEQRFYALLQKLHQEGLAVMMISHDVDAVLSSVTRVICLNQTVLYDGPPDHFEMDKFLPSFYPAAHRALHHHHQGDRHP